MMNMRTLLIYRNQRPVPLFGMPHSDNQKLTNHDNKLLYDLLRPHPAHFFYKLYSAYTPIESLYLVAQDGPRDLYSVHGNFEGIPFLFALSCSQRGASKYGRRI